LIRILLDDYSSRMTTHQGIERRSLVMMRAIVAKIDRDPERKGLQKARSVCRRWAQLHDNPYIDRWERILRGEWTDIRRILLDDSEEGNALRQANPFCGVLTPKERWQIYRECRCS